MSLSDPSQLGEFEILEKLGHGGMGAVYKARQSSLGRLVALKVLPGNMSADEAFIGRFKSEARAAASLNHPGIVQVYAAGEDGGVHYFAMEYVEGESLQGRLDRKGRLTPLEALAICTHVATALNYGWQRARIIHRDIKPDNIFLSNEGAVKLGDLGLAKSLGGESSNLTQTGVSLGTPYYISPEQAHGDKDVDFRSDIYSLGCTLFHLVTGRTPYMASSPMAVMIKHITEPTPDIFKVWPECPPPLRPLLQRMLAKSPADRPQSYEETIAAMMAAHDQIQHPPATLAPTKKVPQTTPAPRAQPKAATHPASKSVQRGNPKLRVYAAVGAVLVALLASVLVWAPRKKPHVAPPVAAVPSIAPAPALPVPDAAGFTSIFNGHDLTGWDGDAKHWSVRNGAIVGETTPGNPAPENTFLIWKGGPVEDFVLLLSCSLTQGNSGVQYRSRMIDPAKWILGGYQLDLDAGKPEWRGALYEERGSRGVMAVAGERVRWSRDGKKELLGKLDGSAPFGGDSWNGVRVTARGNHIVHEINSMTTADVTDEDPARQASTGILGFQLLKGTNTKVQFRDILLKRLPAATPTPKPTAKPATPTPLAAPTSPATTPASTLAPKSPAPVVKPAASAPPPANQKIALFDGRNLDEWKTKDGVPANWPIINGTLEVGFGDLFSKRAFQDCQFHGEFWIPKYPPNITGQKRGNGGIFFQNRYELQILDSFGLPPSTVDCGAIYNLRAPDRNACAKPETWQTFDAAFRAAQFDAAGKKIANARFSVVHNGVTIHNNVEVSASGGSGSPESPEPGPLRLQDHGDKIRFRNIWIIPQ